MEPEARSFAALRMTWAWEDGPGWCGADRLRRREAPACEVSRSREFGGGGIVCKDARSESVRRRMRRPQHGAPRPSRPPAWGPARA